MIFDTLIGLFLDSRKRGTDGARKKCSQPTINIYRDNLRVFANFLADDVEGGVTQYQKVTRLHIIRFIDWADEQVKTQRWAESSKIQVLGTLRTFFKWVEMDEDCREEGLKSLHKYLPSIGVRPRRTDIPATRFLKDFKNSWNTDDKWEYRDYIVTCLMADTGTRIGELCNLQVSHVMLDDRLLYVSGKTGPRSVPISQDMVRLLKLYMKRRPNYPQAEDSDYLFVSKRAPQMNFNTFGQSFRKHRKKFDLPRISAHTFRHAFCTSYLRKGGNMDDLRLRTGHKSYEALSVYLQEAEAGSEEQQKKTEKFSLLKDV